VRELPPVVQLHLATVTLPDWHPAAVESTECVVYGYAIDHPDGLIVFDTGVGAGHDVIDELYQPQVSLLESALNQHSMSLDSVQAVVNSHLHFDHCGQNPLLYESATPFYIGQAEFEAVAADPSYTVAEWAVPPQAQQRSVTADTEIAEGVTVLTAPGHTAGHLALLVEAGGDRIVIAGQAVWSLSEFVDEIAAPANVSEDDMRPVAVDTMRRLKSLKPRTVYFSHCDHYQAGEPS